MPVGGVDGAPLFGSRSELRRWATTASRSVRSASLLVGGRAWLVTKATMALQSLRISRARARIFSVS